MAKQRLGEIRNLWIGGDEVRFIKIKLIAFHGRKGHRCEKCADVLPREN